MTTNELDNSRNQEMTSVLYTAARLTCESIWSFAETRSRFDLQVPLLDPSINRDLVQRGAEWSEVEEVIENAAGPTGFVALSRIDQGSLFSLSGQTVRSTLYLVGNPILARRVAAIAPAATLYAPFRVVVFEDGTRACIAYDEPSSVFQSLGSADVDQIAKDLDKRIKTSVVESCL